MSKQDVFQFKVKKPRAGIGEAPVSGRDIYPPKPKEALPVLGSEDETRLYIALQMAGYKNIQTQVPILGGRSNRGGYVLDFVVYNPQAIPIMMNGARWHRDGSEEFVARAAVYRVFGREPVIIWDYETPTIELAFQAVIREIGRAQ